MSRLHSNKMKKQTINGGFSLGFSLNPKTGGARKKGHTRMMLLNSNHLKEDTVWLETVGSSAQRPFPMFNPQALFLSASFSNQPKRGTNSQKDTPIWVCLKIDEHRQARVLKQLKRHENLSDPPACRSPWHLFLDIPECTCATSSRQAAFHCEGVFLPQRRNGKIACTHRCPFLGK